MEKEKEEKLRLEMIALWKHLQEAKPDDRSELARRYAICITEIQKVISYFDTFIVNEISLSLFDD